MTLRDSLEQVFKQTGKKPDQLIPPGFPDELWYVWAWHAELFTGSELTFQEILAWSQLMRIELTPDEVHVLMQVDRIFWQVHNEGK